MGVTPGAIDLILAKSSPDDGDVIDYVLQVIDLKTIGSSGTKYGCYLNDGKKQLKGVLPAELGVAVRDGELQNMGLIKITNYSCNEINSQRVIVVVKAEIATEKSMHSTGINKEIEHNAAISGTGFGQSIKSGTNEELKPIVSSTVAPETYSKVPTRDIAKAIKTELKHQSAAQIVLEQQSKAVVTSRTSTTRRVCPILALNPYQGSWTIKVRVTNKDQMRSYKNARGGGNVFSVEFTDEEGTEIRATMWKEEADKYFNIFELGKLFYVSKGTLRVANKQYSTVKNDYEMTLNAHTEVEEIIEQAGSPSSIPLMTYNFVKIDELGPYVGGNTLIDLVGILQSVDNITTIRRKRDGDEIPKREILVADQSQKTVSVTLWGKLALEDGAHLAEIVDQSPIVAIKSLKVSDYQGVSLSTVSRSTFTLEPDCPQTAPLRSWYDGEGKGATMVAAGVGLPGATFRNGGRSVYNERSNLKTITDPSIGADKVEYFNVRLCISFIKPDQAMYYKACEKCHKKVTDDASGEFWCEGCQKRSDSFKYRYVLLVKASDSMGEAWISTFNDQAEQIMGITAQELAALKEEGGEAASSYMSVLRRALWQPYVMRLSVAQSEYMNEKRQRVTLRNLHSVDWAGESAHLLQQISALNHPAASQL